MSFGKVVKEMTWRNTYSGRCLQLPCFPSILPKRVLCYAAQLGNGSSSQWPLNKLEYWFLTVCMCRINYLTSLFRERESNGLLTFCCCCSTVPGSYLSHCNYLSVYVLIIFHSRHEIALAKTLGQKYTESMPCGGLMCPWWLSYVANHGGHRLSGTDVHFSGSDPSPACAFPLTEKERGWNVPLLSKYVDSFYVCVWLAWRDCTLGVQYSPWQAFSTVFHKYVT